MKIVYLSLTGNVRKFVEHVGMDSEELNYSNPLVKIDADYILIVPSYDNEITDLISEFIEFKNNKDHLVAFAGSGNRNFNTEYCFNAHALSNKYNKPLIFKFEFNGTNEDIVNFKREVRKIEVTRAK